MAEGRDAGLAEHQRQRQYEQGHDQDAGQKGKIQRKQVEGGNPEDREHDFRQ
ncbi:hypothetical protein D3C72_2521780 [compost metagenome]